MADARKPEADIAFRPRTLEMLLTDPKDEGLLRKGLLIWLRGGFLDIQLAGSLRFELDIFNRVVIVLEQIAALMWLG